MTHIEQAINDALENDWNAALWGYAVDETQKPVHKNSLVVGASAGHHYELSLNDAFVDPKFWQALGKARGWHSFSIHEHGNGEPCNGFCVQDQKGTGWKSRWHRFIDHLADGKNAESFFASTQPPRE